MKSQFLLTVILTCVLFPRTSGFMFAGTPQPTPPLVKISAPFNEIDVTEADNGKSLTLQQGEHLVVTLPDYQDGGYVWSIANTDANPLTQLGQMLYQPPVSSGSHGIIVGGTGTDSWCFQADNSGSTTLTFTDAQPWNPSSSQVGLQLNVTVASQTVAPLQAELQVSEADKGKSLYVRQGDLVVVTLPTNPSIPFFWSVALSKSGFLTQSGDPVFKPTPSTSTTPIVGAGGTNIWTFQASKPGIVALTFTYARSLQIWSVPIKVYSWPIMITSP